MTEDAARAYEQKHGEMGDRERRLFLAGVASQQARIAEVEAALRNFVPAQWGVDENMAISIGRAALRSSEEANRG